MRKLGWFMVVAGAVLGCTQIDAKLNSLRNGTREAEAVQSPTESRRVLVVENTESSASQEIARYYMSKRGIPSLNLAKISVGESEEISYADYKRLIEGPVRSALKKLPAVDFVVFTKGCPIRVDGEFGRSVDSLLASSDLVGQRTGKDESASQIRNPYGAAREGFSSSNFHMWLVTRLDGYSVADAKRLVDNSLAATRRNGLFWMDEAGNRKEGAYGRLQSMLRVSANALKSRGLDARVEDTREFAAPSERLMGYVSWGSNDDAFNGERYKSLRFHPGAIAETFVSTSGRTFRPTSGGQSLIADLIASGVTGVKGYVSEPYIGALAQPQILFDRYTSGFNLAEAFYAASPVVRWKDIVIGDPLCRPYR